MIVHHFEGVRQRSLPGGTAIEEIAAQWEEDPDMAAQMAQARAKLAGTVDRTETLRTLRLKAGLSQALLAQLASTTQAHIAHIEAGAKDPQTDMIDRLAEALHLPPEKVFSAVRAQRSNKARHE